MYSAGSRLRLVHWNGWLGGASQQRWQQTHFCEDFVRACLFETILRSVGAKAKDVHAGCDASAHARRCIFDDNAVARIYSHLAGRIQENIGCRLGLFDIRYAVDSITEFLQQTCGPKGKPYLFVIS